MKSLLGQIIGKYQIVENIGEGGMASVFKAYDESIDRHVAIKVLVADPHAESQRARMLVERNNDGERVNKGLTNSRDGSPRCDTR